MKKYVVRKQRNNVKPFPYDSVDVYLETDSGMTFICECGDWDNENAKKTAKTIAALLNAALSLEGEQ